MTKVGLGLIVFTLVMSMSSRYVMSHWLGSGPQVVVVEEDKESEKGEVAMIKEEVSAKVLGDEVRVEDNGGEIREKEENNLEVKVKSEEENEENEEIDLGEFVYPGSSVKESLATRVTLSSSDSATNITEWYEKTIRNQDFNVRSFVKTSTNGKVHNELVAARSGYELRVLITQDSSNDSVEVVIASGAD